MRAYDLCSRLQIPPQTFQQVWHVLLQLLIDHTILLCNRNLDQMIMATVYGVSRVNQHRITFQSI